MSSRSTVIEHLHDNDSCIAFVYFNYKRQQDQTLSALLASLLRQLFETRQEVKDIIKALYERYSGRMKRPTLEDIKSALRASIDKCGEAYFILDALDEYLEDYNPEQIQELHEVLLSLHDKVRVLATSRVLGGMEMVFDKLQAIRLEILATPEDVRRYVEHRVRQQPAFAKRLKGDLVQLLIEKVAACANGRCVELMEIICVA